MVQVDPLQSYLNLKIGLPPVLKAGSSGRSMQLEAIFLKAFINFHFCLMCSYVNFYWISIYHSKRNLSKLVLIIESLEYLYKELLQIPVIIPP